MFCFKNIFKSKGYKNVFSTANKIQDYIVPYLGMGTQINLVDIGAHSGDFTNDILRLYTVMNGLLAEPIPSLAEKLKNKYSSKGYSVYPNAFTDRDDDLIDFYINDFAETSSMLRIQTQMEELSDVKTQLVEKVTVRTRTLDSVIKENAFPKIDLLKIDVQGSEHLVLLGAKNALKQTRYVWIELSFKPLYLNSSIYYEIITLMQEQGFYLLELSPGHRSPKRELLQVDALFANNRII